ncbi:hypothetical protein [Aliivibrio fischeri]|uniref:hypothetical protein n=1 Tax=Aliivibrio fischeri TaxID=668 RepID=UPI0007C5834C|nr:hypothetical protein [Aliivibrio fischeri]
MSINIPKPTRYVNAFYKPVEGGFDKKEEEKQETARERAARHRQERRAELTFDASDEARWARNRERVIAERQLAAQQAYDFTEPEWNKSLQDDAKKYQWDVSEQQNVSLAILLIEEAEEYLEALQNDTHGVLGDKKDYYGLGSGLRDANDIAKDLGGYGATAKAVSINGTMHIVIENYKPRYLDNGIRWQQATPQMLKMGYALNTVSGNLSLIKSSIFVEIAFSGAINAVDYMMNDEKILGEVIGQFFGDVAVGVVGGIIAQGVVISVVGGLAVFGVTAPVSATMAAFAVVSFIVGIGLSDLNDKHEYTKPMTDKIEAFFNEK